MLRSGDGAVSGFISTSHTLTTPRYCSTSGVTTDIPNLRGSHKIGVSSESTVLYKGLPAATSAGISQIFLLSTDT